MLTERPLLGNVRVAVDPASAAAGAISDLLRGIGARLVPIDQAATADVVFSSQPPGASLDMPAGWVTVTGRSRGYRRNANVALTDARLGFGPVADMLTAAHAVVAGLAVLYQSRRTRRREVAHVTMSEVMATCVADLLVPALCGRTPLPRRPTEERIRIIPCADGAVSVTVASERDRLDLMHMTGIDMLASGWESSLDGLLAVWARQHTRAEIVETGQTWRLPILPVLTPAEAGQSRADMPAPPFRVEAFPAARPERFPIHPGALIAGKFPLGGVRALDLGMVWAGPYCGRLLAGLGAEVVKIEGPRRRDGTRPPEGWAGCDGLFADLNRGKSSLVLDLVGSNGRTVFLDLARRVDVVLDNFSPRVMPNFGLDDPTLAAVNPSLIRLSMPAFSSASNQAHYVSYGSALELMAGLGIPGEHGRWASAPVPYLDLLAGACGAIAIVAALLGRDLDGHGSRIELAQYGIAQQLRSWCPEGLWADQQPDADLGALLADGDLTADGLVSSTSPQGPCTHLARCPWTFQGVRGRAETPAPRFGADSVGVLRDLAKIPAQRIAQLVEQGTVVDSTACREIPV